MAQLSTGQDAGTRNARTALRSRPSSVVLSTVAIAICAVLVLPIAYLVIRSAEATSSSWSLILRWQTVALTARSLGLAAVVTVASIAIGVPAAWLATRSDLPGRRIWGVLFALPLVLPSYVAALAFLSALGPKGLLQQALEPLGVQRLPDLGGFVGAALVLTAVSFPYVYLMTAAGIRGLDPSAEEAARTLGRSRMQVFRSITLPLLRPSIAAGGLLVALYTLHDFGAVSLMRYPTFTQAIYLAYKAAFDRAPAAILSVLLVAIALVILTAEQRARGRASYYRTGTGAKRPLRPVQLRSWRTPATLFSGGVVAVTFLVPAGILVYWSLRQLSSGEGADLTFGPVIGSIGVSAAGALLALIAAFPIALVASRSGTRAGRLVERISYADYALPGIVVALALVFFAANFTPWLYQSLPLVAIAYVILFFPQVSEPLRSALLQLDPHVEQAARTLGSPPRRVLSKVTLPQVLPPALAGAGLVFLTAMKELPATLLLRPTGFETLATRVWTSAAVSDFSKAAIPALLLVVLAAVPLYLVAARVEIKEVRPD